MYFYERFLFKIFQSEMLHGFIRCPCSVQELHSDSPRYPLGSDFRELFESYPLCLAQ